MWRVGIAAEIAMSVVQLEEFGADFKRWLFETFTIGRLQANLALKIRNLYGCR
tara:strand:- start:47 stop:205 length:159 start_codon:yes stop_codon:yes gene_type:complete